MTPIDRAFCEALDRSDPLREYRDRFDVGDDLIYLDGNSLGRPPRDALQRVQQTVSEEWARGLVRSWMDAGWMDAPLRVGAALAPIVGADEDEVVIADSTTVCLFKLLTAALRSRSDRSVVLTERENFPSDLYVAAGTAELLDGRQLRAVPRAELLDAVNSDVAVLVLTHIDFRTAYMHELATVTRRAHDAGALALWDLSHSAGAIEVDVHEARVDLAVGCGYKYLNGGPGAPAFMFVRRELQQHLSNPVPGWLGHDDPFSLETSYRPAPGMRRWITGTPGVIGLATLEIALAPIAQAGGRRLGDKAQRLTQLFLNLADTELADRGFEVVTPRDAAHRGAHVSLRHEHAYSIVQRLIERGVIGDFRDPDLCRFGFAPIYTRFVDVWDAVQQIKAVIDSESYRDSRFVERRYVT